MFFYQYVFHYNRFQPVTSFDSRSLNSRADVINSFYKKINKAFHHSSIKQFIPCDLFGLIFIAAVFLFTSILNTFFFVFITQTWAPNDEFSVNDLPSSLFTFNTFQLQHCLRQTDILTFMSLTPNQGTVFRELLDMAIFECNSACVSLSCQSSNKPFFSSTVMQFTAMLGHCFLST